MIGISPSSGGAPVETTDHEGRDNSFFNGRTGRGFTAYQGKQNNNASQSSKVLEDIGYLLSHALLGFPGNLHQGAFCCIGIANVDSPGTAHQK